jgi:hypothetical protein
MPNSALLPKLFFAGAILFAIGLGLTTYTSPIVGRLHDADLIVVLDQALGDTVPALPGLPMQLKAVAVEGPTQAPGLEVGNRGAGTPAEAGPSNWASRAAASDSAALRGWLTQPVLMTASVEGNSVHITRRRLTLRSGCPLVSHLWSVEERTTGRLVDLSSDCPRLIATDATPILR